MSQCQYTIFIAFFPDKPVSHLLFVIITPLKKKEKKKEGKKERSTGTDDSKKRFM